MDVALLVQVAVVVAVLVALWLLPDRAAHLRRVRRLARRLGVLPPEPPRPPGPPVERIAADAERLRATLRHIPPGTPVARRRGWLEAYDEVLVSACRALGLEQRLDSLPDGLQRDLERQRVERLLVRAGLLRDPTR